MTQRDTYTPEQVAEVAGVTRRTVYRWIASERLPAHKIGPKMWIIYRQVLMAFMAGKETEKLHSMAASLQGRKTVITPAPVPGAIRDPNTPVPPPVSEGYKTAQEESQEALAEIGEEVESSLLDRIKSGRESFFSQPRSQSDYEDALFLAAPLPGTNKQPAKKKKPRR